MSSGLGLCYPVGYPVGVVSELTHNSAKSFVTIILQSSSHLDQLQQVLMVGAQGICQQMLYKKS